ncbi:pyrroloquinoline quinone biosynthesis protein [Nocardiopsis exhalans]|uniref:Pyrroloquinoline quinone biosynthesis protein n=1 Tax=Nocardiopsis exhalans TaxID=163604 RepID=A0ABY5D8A2_9ACTN|nr:pyrroloquinoline quinone biosynthesis protein [Nocardiopsis exhalans]USY19615.1 pyrroloquinoline quinone biosynthesis protein [Nocardiopsis exhalans]
MAGLLLLTACGLGPYPTGPTDAEPRNDPAAPPPTTLGALPYPLEGPALWTAPFSAEPKAAGASFVGVAQERTGGPIRFLGVDREGVTRWAAERDPSCTGFTVARPGTEDDGSEFVVLLDRVADPDAGVFAAVTTASAHDPDTGERLWGPTEVPGTLVGPGLVFAALPGSVMSDETGPKAALSALTGEVAADERDGGTVLHEHHGALLLHRDGALRAVGPEDEDLWTHTGLEVPAELGNEPVAVGYGPRPASDSSAAVVLEWTEQGTAEEAAEADPLLYTVHDLRSGERLLTLDPDHQPRLLGDSQGRTVVLGVPAGEGEPALFGLSASDPGPVWELPALPGERLSGLVGDTLYTRVSEGEPGRAIEADTGQVAADPVTGRAPVAALPGGPAILRAPDSDAEAGTRTDTRTDADTPFAALPVS